MTEKVWITGANGMLGRAIADALKSTRSELTVLTPSHRQLDLTDLAAVRGFLDVHQPDTVIHAAGLVGGIAANVAEPVRFLVDNMQIGLNVIDGCRRAGIQNLVNIGSSCMYPKDSPELLTEDMILAGHLEPTNEGYAIAKIAADRLCEYTSQEFGLNYRTVIPSNLYGPGDHFDDRRGHLIANAMRKIHAARIQGSRAVIVWGDGTARREFTYVGDVAAYLSEIVGTGTVGNLPQRLNIGIGVDHSVADFYTAISKVVGWSGQLEYDLTKPSGMKRKLMDSTVARIHGWSPSVTLSDGLQRTYKYYLETL